MVTGIIIMVTVMEMRMMAILNMTIIHEENVLHSKTILPAIYNNQCHSDEIAVNDDDCVDNAHGNVGDDGHDSSHSNDYDDDDDN
jgi:hypothetical protein